MNILVTGGTGFVGSHLVEYLVANGNAVRCLARRTSHLANIMYNNCHCICGDVSDYASLEPAVNGVEYVYHLAALQTKYAAQQEFHRVNVLGTRNVLEACCRFSPNLKRFVHVSSHSAVGARNITRAVTEDDECLPADNYGKSKLAGEQVAFEYRKRIPLTTIRPTYVYGPGESNPYSILRHIKMVKRGFYFARQSGRRYFSIIHVKDLVEGLTAAAESDKSEGATYFMCNDRPTSHEEICELSAQAMKIDVIRIPLPGFILRTRCLLKDLHRTTIARYRYEFHAKGHKEGQQHWIADCSKAKRELGFQAKIVLADGIQETVDWYVKNGWL